ncbi:hypothetical protein BJY04DRAFT_214020 [Aspergillus karnatakaensis]|uniref:uncharacterized protein n=1 Tax=Aspergillus karnatakaensis TaxID=1810916 RepID=UPI003CCE149A
MAPGIGLGIGIGGDESPEEEERRRELVHAEYYDDDTRSNDNIPSQSEASDNTTPHSSPSQRYESPPHSSFTVDSQQSGRSISPQTSSPASSEGSPEARRNSTDSYNGRRDVKGKGRQVVVMESDEEEEQQHTPQSSPPENQTNSPPARSPEEEAQLSWLRSHMADMKNPKPRSNPPPQPLRTPDSNASSSSKISPLVNNGNPSSASKIRTRRRISYSDASTTDDSSESGNEEIAMLRRAKKENQKMFARLMADPDLNEEKRLSKIMEWVTQIQVAEENARLLVYDLRNTMKMMHKEQSELQRNADETWNDLIRRMDELKEVKEKLDQTEADNREQRRIITANKAATARGAAGTTAKEAAVKEEMDAIRGRLARMEWRDGEMKDKIAEREAMILETQQSLGAANQAIEHYRALLERAEKDTSGYGESIHGYVGLLTKENAKLREQLIRVSTFMAGNRAADAGRWDEVKYEPKLIQPPPQLPPTKPSVPTYGTIDRNIPDAPAPGRVEEIIEEDSPIPTQTPSRKTPLMLKMQRRIARTKNRPRRAGSESPDAARPTDIKRRFREERAASTYLQYRDKKNEVDDSLLRTKGRHTGVLKVYPRKRTRLTNASVLEQRVDAVTKTSRLSHLTVGDLMKMRPKVGLTVYDRRNDAEMARRLEAISFDRDGPGPEYVSPPKDADDSSLVTIARTVVPFLPRKWMFTHGTPPRSTLNLPNITKDERRHWQKVAKTWTLGPDMSKKKKKNVRFNDKVEYEPSDSGSERRSEPSGPPRGPGAFIDFLSAMIRVLLIIVLLLSVCVLLQYIFSLIFQRAIPGEWIDANVLPNDIASRIRSSGPDGRPKVYEFEVARWSDVDAEIYG